MRRALILACCVLAFGLCLRCVADEFGNALPPMGRLPREGLANIDRFPPLPDPSGITYHPGTKTLFAVGDRGYLAEIGLDGAKLRQRRFRHGDFEGITVDPATGLLYLAWEGPENILEVDARSWEVRREWRIAPLFEGRTIFKPGDNHGLESIAFVPAPEHPEGGTFFVTNQSTSLKKRPPSALVELLVPLRTQEQPHGTARILRVFELGVVDLAACHFDAARKCLWVVSDDEKMLLQVGLDGKILRRARLPGKNQEGFTLDAAGFAYIAQDSGGILRFKFDGIR